MSVRKSLPDRKRTLSSQEKRITELVSRGLKNREIAMELGIEVHVVRNYVSSIFDKVGMSNRVELALWYSARQIRGDEF
jgi:DNA-binding NarL/FixJ family response regulator